jgi:hypothetical protein
MDQEETQVAPAEAAEPTPQPEPQPEESQGSEPQTNAEPEGRDEGNSDKMIEIPAKKWREKNISERKLKEELAKYQTPREPSQPSQSAEQPQNETDATIKQIAEAVKAELAPSLGSLKHLEKMSYQQAVEEVSQKPYAEELVGDIANIYANAPELQNMPVTERMQAAYKWAVAENIDKITAKSHQSGYDASYQKQAEKQSAEGMQAGGAQSREAGEFTPEQIRNMSPAEYNKNKDRIFAQYGM